MKPHKHAELIKAWADGAEIEYRRLESWGMSDWQLVSNRLFVWYENDVHEYRIKPESKTAEQQSGYSRLEWAKDLIKQLPENHDGRNSWLLNYGTKPDVERMYLVGDMWNILLTHKNPQLKLTFDGETGELKSAEVLK